MSPQLAVSGPYFGPYLLDSASLGGESQKATDSLGINGLSREWAQQDLNLRLPPCEESSQPHIACFQAVSFVGSGLFGGSCSASPYSNRICVRPFPAADFGAVVVAGGAR
jgi:hypothetical protein